MENQNLEKPKKSYWKFVAGFLGVIIAVFVLYVVGVLGWQKYKYWQDEKTAQKAEEGIRKWQQEDYERAMADTYGGKTPQETLQMYIEAVEKGDYELASKYFIGSKQEGELNNLKASNNDTLKTYLKYIKNAIPWRSSLNDKDFIMEAKIDLGPSIFIRFKIYPNGIWKIIEI